MNKKTALIGNLRRVYREYGGVRAVLLSEYAWASLAITALCWRLMTGDKWVEISQLLIPPLAGFSIAAYALLFAVLSEKDRQRLRPKSKDLGNRSPLLVLASSITHAVIVQITAIILGTIYLAKPLPYFVRLSALAEGINVAFSAVGIFFVAYGIVLVLAAMLTIFRLLGIGSAEQSTITTHPDGGNVGGDTTAH